MFELERVCVQRLAIDENALSFGDIGAGDIAKGQVIASRIELVGDDRVPDMGQMDPNLMGPASLGPAADEGISPKSLLDLVKRDRFAAAVLGESDRHLLAMSGMEADGPLDVITVAVGHAVDDRQVL